mmetsp:Transcript_45745/g.110881  ORF Transcript_45745/g.110881 Transcript_45745/m.110881 type:complete len:153 (-) Transcript_45745:191-649(-)
MVTQEPPAMLQRVFSRSRGTKSPPRPTPKRTEANNGGLPSASSGGFEILDTLDPKNRAGSGTSTNRDLDEFDCDVGSLSADEADTGEDGIIRSGRKRLAKARIAYREDPEYWTGRRGSTILQRATGRRRSSMMYPQVKETAESAALACSLMI